MNILAIYHNFLCREKSVWPILDNLLHSEKEIRLKMLTKTSVPEKKPLQYMTSLTLNVTISKTNCSGIKEAYNSHYQAQFSTFNSIYGSQLCGQFQCTLLANTFTCDSDAKGTITVDLGLLPWVGLIKLLKVNFIYYNLLSNKISYMTWKCQPT